MNSLFPYRYHILKHKVLITNDAGDFFLSSKNFLKKLINKDLSPNDMAFLERTGFSFKHENDFFYNSFIHRLRLKKQTKKDTSYIIIIPTLRCDLSCDYCQVSRANLDAKGFDWSPEILDAFKKFLLQYNGQNVKIEFQGGEPSLRMDVIEAIIDHCDQNNIKAQFVICTNLSSLSDSLKNLLKRPDFFVSTSIDGEENTHTQNRTKDKNITAAMMDHYKEIKEEYGNEKISALPTITGDNFEQIKELIDHYIALGQTSIFLRPVNYHGFARKKFSGSRDDGIAWLTLYLKALKYIFDKNFYDGHEITEFGFEVAIRRIFTNHNLHVDMRSPNPALRDYMVINYDGTLYPSDEARMLSRIKHADLSMGNILTGIDTKTVNSYNWNQMNEVHEDCVHCAYLPYCGIDTVDDLSRYGRVDLPKHKTFFCSFNMGVFNSIFEALENNGIVTWYNINGHLNGKFSQNPVLSEWIYD
ncbi:MAG: His-Xaa-Ser system radical SAM maturase HxsB [Alphaproteobacteria bacterium]